MKIKRIATCLLAGFLTLSTAISIPASTVSAAKQKAPAPGSLSSNSAIVMELSTGTILYSKNIHTHHFPASITKIMTSLLTIENCSLNETVTFKPDAVYGIEAGSSTIYSLVNEKLSVEQCLYAIMLESANEVCLGVADHISGNKKNFVNLMNQRVASLGLKDTHFMNPNGLHNDKHYTSAYDMACIAREAFKNKTFQKIVKTKVYTIPPTNKQKQQRFLQNHNQMLYGYKQPKYQYKYCIGGKTGYTTMAHATLVEFAEKDGMQLVSVVMKGNSGIQGEPNEYTDSTKLLNYGFSAYRKHAVNSKNSTLTKDLFDTYDSYYNTSESPVRLSGEASVVLPKGVPLSAAKQKITYFKNVNLKSGDNNVIGNVTYSYKGKTVGATDILYRNTKNKNHLDEASRKIINSEINQIKKDNKKWGPFRFIASKTSVIRNSIAQTSFSSVLEFLIRIVLLLIAFGFGWVAVRAIQNAVYVKRRGHKRNRSRSRSDRSSRKSARTKSINFNSKKRGKKKRGTDFTSSRRVNRSPKEGYKGFNSKKAKKNRKKTKESFGKSFYDF